MNIVYSDQEPHFDNVSIFLAGPTYRDGDTVVAGSFWRKEAIQVLQDLNFDGIVFAPERSVGFRGDFHYDNQIDWEFDCLENCTSRVFWVPRNEFHLKAMTTNVEFGRYMHYRNTLYGRPDDSHRNRYLDVMYGKFHDIKPYNSLKDLMSHSVQMAYELGGKINV